MSDPLLVRWTALIDKIKRQGGLTMSADDVGELIKSMLDLCADRVVEARQQGRIAGYREGRAAVWDEMRECVQENADRADQIALDQRDREATR